MSCFAPSPVAAHYEALLGARYTWMLGGLEACMSAAHELVADLGLTESSGRRILDLGCGPGYHARALADQGAEVVAVDISEQCLKELRALCDEKSVTAIGAAIGDTVAYRDLAPYVAILCLGDTLPHLRTHDEVLRVLADSHSMLEAGGRLVLEFREQLVELSPSECVMTLRADPQRIMQCVLHYQTERMWVTDVVHEWRDGVWATLKSTYPKLRLAGAALVQAAERLKYTVLTNTVRRGRRLLVLQK